jgi:hypothetical protein
VLLPATAQKVTGATISDNGNTQTWTGVITVGGKTKDDQHVDGGADL